FPAADGLTSAQNLERKLGEWIKWQESKAVHWQVMQPARAVSNRPLLTIQRDDSVIASGDMGKRDLYDLDFRFLPLGITAIRLEVLPDDSLPRHGPGRVFYEGPFGDFFLSEVTV